MEMNLKSLRKQIGLVQQEPALFTTSIFKIILYGKEASESEVIKAAKLANAHLEGYSTKACETERRVQHSSSQRQMVAIVS